MGQLECCGATHQGFKKDVNEDQFLIADVRKSLQVWQTSLTIDDRSKVFGNSVGKLLAVADGAGSPESATRASTITVEKLIDFAINEFSWNTAVDDDSLRRLRRELTDAFWNCQESIAREAQVLTNSLDRDMASSVTMAIVNWPALHIASVGDCRCYLFRENQLKPLTVDQTVPREAIPLDARKGSETMSDDGSHIIVNVVGGVDSKLVPHVQTQELTFGDTLLLCTDGLVEQLPEKRIAEILGAPISAADSCNSLINDALATGECDNVTVIVGKFLTKGQNMMVGRAAVETSLKEDRANEPQAAH